MPKVLQKIKSIVRPSDNKGYYHHLKKESNSPAPNHQTELPKKSHNSRGTLSTILVILIAPVIALVLTFFVFQQYEVDGPSMQSTLQNNNRLIVLKVPRTWARITGHPYIPRRGDIIVFQEANLYNLGTTGTDQLIKRVIGLPGDRFVIKNGSITIYNKQHPNGFDPDRTMPYGNVIGATAGNEDIVIPKNEVFVCGDNRGDSLDSRVFGPISVDNIVGKLIIRFVPLNEYRDF